MELAALSATAPPCSLQAAATQLHLHPCTPGLWKHHRMLTKRHHFFALLHCVAFCLWQFCCLTRYKGLALPFSVLHSKFCFHSTTPHLTKMWPHCSLPVLARDGPFTQRRALLMQMEVLHSPAAAAAFLFSAPPASAPIRTSSAAYGTAHFGKTLAVLLEQCSSQTNRTGITN